MQPKTFSKIPDHKIRLSWNAETNHIDIHQYVHYSTAQSVHMDTSVWKMSLTTIWPLHSHNLTSTHIHYSFLYYFANIHTSDQSCRYPKVFGYLLGLNDTNLIQLYISVSLVSFMQKYTLIHKHFAFLSFNASFTQ